MMRTQIQLPDELYRRIKAIAETREWTFTEAVRRGLERYAESCHVEEPAAEWVFPVLKGRPMLVDPARIGHEADAIEERQR